MAVAKPAPPPRVGQHRLDEGLVARGEQRRVLEHRGVGLLDLRRRDHIDHRAHRTTVAGGIGVGGRARLTADLRPRAAHTEGAVDGGHRHVQTARHHRRGQRRGARRRRLPGSWRPRRTRSPPSVRSRSNREGPPAGSRRDRRWRRRTTAPRRCAPWSRASGSTAAPAAMGISPASTVKRASRTMRCPRVNDDARAPLGRRGAYRYHAGSGLGVPSPSASHSSAAVPVTANVSSTTPTGAGG